MERRAFMNDMVAACSATLSDLQMYGMLTKNTRDNVFFTGVFLVRGVLDFWTIVQVDLVKSHYGIYSAHWLPSFF